MGIKSKQYAVIDADFYIKMTQYACDQGVLFLRLMQTTESDNYKCISREAG